MTRGRLALLALLGMLATSAWAAPPSSIGRRVYDSVCIACHGPQNVMVDSPKAGDAAAWRIRARRSARGIETLVDNAIAGVGAMPPKAAHYELSRVEIRAAIEFMMVKQPPAGTPGVR